MPPLIISRPPPGQIRYAIEKLIEGKRLLQIRREHAHNQSVTDEWIEMAHCDRPLLCILNVDNDIDEVLLKDIVQSVVGRKAAKRLNKPNITLLYHEYNAMRAAEFKGQRQFAVQTKDNSDASS